MHAFIHIQVPREVKNQRALARNAYQIKKIGNDVIIQM